MSPVARVAVLTVFRHHRYQFNDKSYKEEVGMPIGLRLTSIVAQIVMDEWAYSFITRVMDAGVTLHMIAKYVDDMNLILAGLALGTRWVDRALVHSMQLEAEDIEKKRSVEDVTMTCMRVAAENITPWLKFTHDSPEINTCRIVPILDLHVWVRHQDPGEDGLGADLLAWAFYKKPVASFKLIMSILSLYLAK